MNWLRQLTITITGLLRGDYLSLKRRRRREVQFKRVLHQLVLDNFTSVVTGDTVYETLISQVLNGEQGPVSASEALLEVFTDKLSI